MKLSRIVTTLGAVVCVSWIACSLDPDYPCIDTFGANDGPDLWTKLEATGPSARERHTAVFDEEGDRLIVYGGRFEAGTAPLGDVWVLENATDIGGGAAWRKLAPTGTAPPARFAHVAAYDAANNRMIVYGGSDGKINLSDTWVLTNANGVGEAPAWTSITTMNPPTRLEAVGVYDETSGSLVVFGGSAGSGATPSSDVWVLSNANGMAATPSAWTKSDATGLPSGRQSMAAAHDPAERRMFIYGGSGDEIEKTALGDTFVLAPLASSPSAFEEISAAAKPKPRRGASLVFDPVTARGVMFAGFMPDLLDADTYTLTTKDPRTWAHYETGNRPPFRAGHVAAYSKKSNRMVMFGGRGAPRGRTVAALDDTWVLDRANGEPAFVPDHIEIQAPTYPRVCSGNTHKLFVVARGPGAPAAPASPENPKGQIPVVWSSDPPRIGPDGTLPPGLSGKIVVRARTPDGKLTAEKTVELAPGGGTRSSGGSSGSSGTGSSGGSSGGGTCTGGFLATQRTCTVVNGPCSCDDFPCSACIPSADFPQAQGHALAEGEQGCVDGDTGAIVKPCAPGLCCLVGGGACGNPTGGSHCGQCLPESACP